MAIPEAFRQLVLQAMPNPPAWATTRQIYERMDQGAYHTIRQTLVQLALAGTIARFGPIMEPAYRKLIPGQPIDKKLLALMEQHKRELAERAKPT